MWKQGGEWHHKCFKTSTQNFKYQSLITDYGLKFDIQILIISHKTTPNTDQRRLQDNLTLIGAEETIPFDVWVR